MNMASFKSSIMMICIIINIVNAGYYEDLWKCIGQLKSAFQYERAFAVSCLKYSIKFYITGQHIPVPEGVLIDFVPDWQNELNKTTILKTPDESDGQQVIVDEFIAQWYENELNKKVSGKYWKKDDKQQIAEAEFIAQWYENELNKMATKNQEEDDGQQVVGGSSQSYSAQQDYASSSKENDFGISEHDMYDPEDVERWWSKQDWVINSDKQNIEGSSQNVSDNINLTAGHNVDIVKFNQNYPLNYAELYYIELEHMIVGKGVPNSIKFCNEYFPLPEDNYACYYFLQPFGNQPIGAVRVAYKYLTLAGCERLKKTDPKYVFIHRYMEIIIDNCRTELSTNPNKFCENKMKKKHNVT